MALKVVKKKADEKVKSLFSIDDFGKMGREYADLSAQIKQLDEKRKLIAEKIKEGAEKFGVKDDKGSFYLEDDNFIIGKIAKKSISINQEKAVQVLQSLGLGDVIDTITSEVVNENKLQQAIQDKRISFDTVEGFTDVRTSYAVIVKKKEEAPEIEATTLKVARKK